MPQTSRSKADSARLADEELRSASMAVGPHHQPRMLTNAEREVWRLRSETSRLAKRAALRGELEPLHELNVPKLNPYDLMPQVEPRDGSAISLFSGGGGL